MSQTFILDGKTISFADGQTIMQAATLACYRELCPE